MIESIERGEALNKLYIPLSSMKSKKCECGCGRDARTKLGYYSLGCANRFRLKGKTWEQIHGKRGEVSLRKLVSKRRGKSLLELYGKDVVDRHRARVIEVFKGKTWEQLYGVVRARKMRANMSKNCYPRKLKGKTFDEIYSKKKSSEIKDRQSKHCHFRKNRGKTYEQIYGVKKGKEFRKIISVAHTGVKWSDDCKIAWSKRWSGMSWDERYGKKMADRLRELRRKKLGTTFLNFRATQKPNSLEKRFLALITRNKLPYKYVGNAKLWIGGINPDFINTQGKKIFIEVYAKFFKNLYYGSEKSYRRRRLAIAAKHGYKVIFIRDKELKNEQFVLNKIMRGDF